MKPPPNPEPSLSPTKASSSGRAQRTSRTAKEKRKSTAPYPLPTAPAPAGSRTKDALTAVPSGIPVKSPTRKTKRPRAATGPKKVKSSRKPSGRGTKEVLSASASTPGSGSGSLPVVQSPKAPVSGAEKENQGQANISTVSKPLSGHSLKPLSSKSPFSAITIAPSKDLAVANATASSSLSAPATTSKAQAAPRKRAARRSSRGTKAKKTAQKTSEDVQVQAPVPRNTGKKLGVRERLLKCGRDAQKQLKAQEFNPRRKRN
ncbi:hypothetical protein ONZ45_g9565 [Pleurotus djamor]|nr:hypothetical protein ONZ45_g9565 [Pleurotus djamor]